MTAAKEEGGFIVRASTSLADFVSSLERPQALLLLVPWKAGRGGNRLAAAAAQPWRCDRRHGQRVVPRDGGAPEARRSDGHPLRRLRLSGGGGARGARRGPSGPPGGPRESWELLKPRVGGAAPVGFADVTQPQRAPLTYRASLFVCANEHRRAPCISARIHYRPRGECRAGGLPMREVHWAGRLGTLREDGPQWYRVRRHAANSGGLPTYAKEMGGLTAPEIANLFDRLNEGPLSCFLMETTASGAPQGGPRGRVRLPYRITRAPRL